jgi:hypothetical protein
MTDLDLTISFTPRRPLSQTIKLSVQNPLRQEWQFTLELNVELGQIQESLMIESLLNKTGKAKIHLPTVFSTQVPFHAYFVSGSASEFSVSPSHGMIEPTLLPTTEVPIDVVFAPKMYGKVLKGMLVIDTVDAQWLFDIFGKTPEYVPPVVTRPRELAEWSQPQMALENKQNKRHNIVRENIENAKRGKIRASSVAQAVLPPLK